MSRHTFPLYKTELLGLSFNDKDDFSVVSETGGLEEKLQVLPNWESNL